ncbi:MAG: M50 family metallopeptidase [Kyrpidia sp.]|nr:M50 family metallopeptidase [Kyrpidia sp.]
MSTGLPGWRMPLRVHPLFLFLLILAAASGLVWEVAVVFCVVALHELAHVVVARALGYRVREMTLLPFGGVAVIEPKFSRWSPDDEVWIAAAGPLCNGLQIAAALALYSAQLWTEGFAAFFVRVNLTIALFNLLPALPLDGGRIWRAMGSRTFGYGRAGELAVGSAFWCSGALAVLGTGTALWGTPHVGMWGLALFLAVSARHSQREVPYESVKWLYGLRGKVGEEPVAVRSLAVNRRVRAGDIARYFAPNAFHVIAVLDDAGSVAFILEEKEFLDFLFAPGGFGKAIGEWRPGS